MHFDNDETSKIDDVLTEHGKLVVGWLLGFGDLGVWGLGLDNICKIHTSQT